MVLGSIWIHTMALPHWPQVFWPNKRHTFIAIEKTIQTDKQWIMADNNFPSFLAAGRHEIITKEILELDPADNVWTVLERRAAMHDSYDVCLVANLNPRDLISPWCLSLSLWLHLLWVWSDSVLLTTCQTFVQFCSLIHSISCQISVTMQHVCKDLTELLQESNDLTKYLCQIWFDCMNPLTLRQFST